MSNRGLSIACVGGGPAGLYFALLAKRDDPSRRVTVYERNQPDDTFGFGVIFADATLESFAKADPTSHTEIQAACVRWDDLEVHTGNERVVSTGHGFSGLGRRRMLALLHARAAALGVELRFGEEPDLATLMAGHDLVVAADGANSVARTRYAKELGPSADERPNRFVWLGSTQPLSAFTFYFDRDAAGLFRVHAYRYDATRSTFIVECTAETFARTGLDPLDEAATVRYCEQLFAHRLEGHRLLSNRSVWRRFATLRTKHWSTGNLVLLGDAAHTAHFSIGSGTKLAIDSAIALAAAFRTEETVASALAAYERARRPAVERVQRAAQTSLLWFEETERYVDRLDPLSLTYSLLTRSLRIDHGNLRVRDAALTARVDEAFRARAPLPPPKHASPMFVPLKLRELILDNRVGVAPMCQYRAKDGIVGDWHLVHYGSLAIGGAGLLLFEHTAVSAEGRITPGCAGLWNAAQAAALRRVVDFCRAEGRAKLGLQIGHAGRKGSTRVIWEGRDQPLTEGAWPLCAASPLAYGPGSQVPAELDRAGMDRIIAAFVRSAQLAAEVGFDLIELQLGHGHLLADFLSPLTNRRKDAYGGPLAQRLAFPIEVLDAVRAAWPSARPLAVRISASDWQAGGLPIEEAVEIARTLAAHGCDIVDVSSGETTAEGRAPHGRQYQVRLSEQIRLDAGVLTMTSGAIATGGDVNTVLAAGRADLCLLGRTHLHNPYFIHDAAVREGIEPSWPLPYQSLRGYRPHG